MTSIAIAQSSHCYELTASKLCLFFKRIIYVEDKNPKRNKRKCFSYVTDKRKRMTVAYLGVVAE